MRIVLLTIGSRGDVQPFVVLGVELKARGHEVVLAAGAEFKSLADRAGLGFRALEALPAGYADSVLRDPKVQAALRRGPSMYRMAMAAPRLTGAQQQALIDEMVAAGEGADMVVNTTLTRIGALGRRTCRGVRSRPGR
ncbi:glycosyltransferase [Streptomyces scabiei]|uniref:glycosyltransferase n=1 Tax=Streptomyces scabiei TaxID=1930 RepID=UPI002FF24564